MLFPFMQNGFIQETRFCVDNRVIDECFILIRLTVSDWSIMK